MGANLINSLQEIRDFRASRGRRYPLWLILLLVIMGTISGCRSYYALEDFEARHFLLVVDRAGWHISRDLKIPLGLHLSFLPSYSPELQPAERLWTLVDEPIANQSFETLDNLEDVLFHRCQSLLQMQDLIQGLTDFHWWTKIGV